MALISWGGCTIWISKLDALGAPTTWTKVPTPAEGTTTLEVSKGDKKEAKVEGGLLEAVKYNKNTYSLSFEVRAMDGRDKIAEDTDGVIAGEYALKLQPEDTAADGIRIDRGILSMEPSYSSDEGIKWKYTLDALIPKDDSNTVKYEPITDPTAKNVNGD